MMVVSHGFPDVKVVANQQPNGVAWDVECFSVGQHVHDTLGSVGGGRATLMHGTDPTAEGLPWHLVGGIAGDRTSSFGSASEAMHELAAMYRRRGGGE